MIIQQLTSCTDPNWSAVKALYEKSFPTWEREPCDAIEKNIEQNKSFCVVAFEGGELAGSYICDANQELRFLLLSYVFVDEKHRGKGIGAQLCTHLKQFLAMHQQRFDWLLLETEEHNIEFYRRLGYKKVDIDYLSPHFDSQDSTPMTLMLVGNSEHQLTQSMLVGIITNIFLHGYGLTKHSERLNVQLKKIPKTIKLL